jgi:hypothetical protein
MVFPWPVNIQNKRRARGARVRPATAATNNAKQAVVIEPAGIIRAGFFCDVDKVTATEIPKASRTDLK